MWCLILLLGIFIILLAIILSKKFKDKLIWALYLLGLLVILFSLIFLIEYDLDEMQKEEKSPMQKMTIPIYINPVNKYQTERGFTPTNLELNILAPK